MHQNGISIWKEISNNYHVPQNITKKLNPLSFLRLVCNSIQVWEYEKKV